MRSSFVLCHALGVFAALGGRELGHPDLAIPSTHSQSGVTAVGEELGLEKSKWRGGFQHQGRSLCMHGWKRGETGEKLAWYSPSEHSSCPWLFPKLLLTRARGAEGVSSAGHGGISPHRPQPGLHQTVDFRAQQWVLMVSYHRTAVGLLTAPSFNNRFLLPCTALSSWNYMLLEQAPTHRGGSSITPSPPRTLPACSSPGKRCSCGHSRTPALAAS